MEDSTFTSQKWIESRSIYFGDEMSDKMTDKNIDVCIFHLVFALPSHYPGICLFSMYISLPMHFGE